MAKTQEAGVNTDNLERGSPLGFLNTDMALWLTLAIPPEPEYPKVQLKVCIYLKSRFLSLPHLTPQSGSYMLNFHRFPLLILSRIVLPCPFPFLKILPSFQLVNEQYVRFKKTPHCRRVPRATRTARAVTNVYDERACRRRGLRETR
jgi:hypothetical protein